jgi:Na+/H+ antiporter NhaD/arsenite permease-like protein
MLLSIGNPTNIYLSSGFEISFLDYVSKMWLPTLLSGVSTLLIILLLFKKELAKPIENIEIEDVQLKNKPLVIINLIILGLKKNWNKNNLKVYMSHNKNGLNK